MPTVVLKLFAGQSTGQTDGYTTIMLSPLGSIKMDQVKHSGWNVVSVCEWR